ncbi:MAG: hypothetical protein JNL88_07025 [Bacteroidia bacterium]|nr:hypothetical protein [Bacteroidia bacterium]
MKKGYLVFALLMGIVIQTSGQIPVILRVTAAEQSDTTGCNFVKELARISWLAISSGKAKLWNAPSKDFQITPQSLRDIDASAGTSFTDQEVVFIYEYWTNINRELKSTTTGFLFSNKSKRGEDVEYGYVEFRDLQEFFLRERVETNSNGNFNTNLASVLHSKSFNYQFLQFAGKVIDNVSDSRKIRDEYIGQLRFNVSAFSLNEVPQKMVTWTLDPSPDVTKEKSVNGNKLISALGDYLRANEEVFLNLGGDKIPGVQLKGRWKITRIEVSELWKKISGETLYDPLTLKMYINDSALAEIPYRDLLKMDVKIMDIALTDFLRVKEFNYVIRRVNQQDIPRSEAYLYQKALYEAEWNKLTIWVAANR